jgi:hypothetical protein
MSVSLYHCRTATGQGVDVSLENPQGRLVAVETEPAASVERRYFKGIKSIFTTRID